MKKILEKRDAEVGAEEISAPMNDTENWKQAIIKTKKKPLAITGRFCQHQVSAKIKNK